MRESTFGMNALGDPGLVRTLRAGRRPRAATARRVLAYARLQIADRLAAANISAPQPQPPTKRELSYLAFTCLREAIAPEYLVMMADAMRAAAAEIRAIGRGAE